MAIDLRNSKKQGKRLTEEEAALLADVSRLQSCLQGHCFTALNFIQRTATHVGIKLALFGAASAADHMELRPEGWALHTAMVPDCEVATTPAEPTLAERIAKSYEHDYASQRARMVVRTQTSEADDAYFAPADDDDTGEFSPVLQRFRERTAFQLQEA
jgi:hypothetical protein